MMPPPTYTEELRRAKYHVQVEIEDRDEVDQTPADIPVRCRVRRAFRGDDLHVGDAVRFTVSVFSRGDVIRLGGEGWMDYAYFQKARYFEVFLYGLPPDCEVALSQIFIIGRISLWPKIAVPTESELDAEWAYFKFHGHFGAPFTIRNGLVWWPIRLWRRVRWERNQRRIPAAGCTDPTQ